MVVYCPFHAEPTSDAIKFICFGYLDVENWAKKSPSEQNALIDACFGDDEVLKKNGHWVGGEGLQGPSTAATLRYQNGKVLRTVGPPAETKELLGGPLIVEARDLVHATELISNHPGIQMRHWEIRPAADLWEMIAESN